MNDYRELPDLLKTVYRIVDRAGVAGVSILDVAKAKYGPHVTPERSATMADAIRSLVQRGYVVQPVTGVLTYVTIRHAERAQDVCSDALAAAVMDDALELPQCAIAMGCLCTGHAAGYPATAECDTDEARAEAFAAGHEVFGDDEVQS